MAQCTECTEVLVYRVIAGRTILCLMLVRAYNSPVERDIPVLAAFAPGGIMPSGIIYALYK